ncbi:hypothetical protein GCM10018791_10370 [Streptomyces zaomyceticus]|nr:hypothetical protein GCM10018791_10370 [Streptomyces zaomyceticus]
MRAWPVASAPWAEATPAPAATMPPATMVRAAAFLRFFTGYILLVIAAAGQQQHAMENAVPLMRLRRTGDIHTTV